MQHSSNAISYGNCNIGNQLPRKDFNIFYFLSATATLRINYQ